jgi:multiple sugar transport system substrate-binding protein
VRLVAGLLGLLMVAAACAGASNSEVTVLVAGDPFELAAYREVVEASGLDVRLIEVAERDEMIARLSSSIAAGEPPDLFLLNYRYLSQFVATGAISPMQSFMDRSDVLAEGDFYPSVLDVFRENGTLTCLAQNAATLVVYFNERLFAAADVPRPDDGWTWDEMVGRAQLLTRDVDDDGIVDVHGLGVEPEIIRIAPLVWSAGSELVDDEDEPTRFALANPEAVGAFQAFVDLRGRFEVVPTDEEAESQDLESRFLAGRIAMLIESRKVVPSFRTIESFDWDVAPLPRLGEPANVLHSDAYCLTESSDRKEAAFRFVEFALGPEGQRILAETGRIVPVRPDVAESEAFLDPRESPASSQVFLDQLATTRALPRIATWPEIEDAANALIEEAFYDPAGGSEAGELVLSLIKSTRPLFARDN